MIVFAYPLMFLLLIVPFACYYFLPAVKGLYGEALKVPFLDDLKRISISSGSLWNSGRQTSKPSEKFWLTYFIWTLLCIAAARPQMMGDPIRLKNESRDIMLVLDISTSMLEKDFSFGGYRISRLDAVKKVVSEFADKRANDQIGLILFGTRAYMQSPLTFDKSAIKDILYSMQAGMAGDSTSIGDALALALKKMRKTANPKQSVIILLTDGENNDGSLSIGQAIKLAAEEGIKTYTIGVGSADIFFKMLSLSSSGVDEQALKLLAKATKGQYFRAENTADLQKIYQLIDTLEPTSNDERYIKETTDLYYLPLLLAIATMFVAFVKKGAR